MSSPYYTNQGVREEIDRLLKSNAKIQANLGLESTEEERLRAVELWQHYLVQIAKLDPEFAEVLEPQNS
jgi:hypothetical protein